MIRYRVRTDLSTSLPDDLSADVRLLDWAPGDVAATIQTGDHGPAFFSGWRPPRPAADLLMLGAAAYCVDKTARRSRRPDRWTRDLALELPVGDVSAWAKADWPQVLNFLTGDHWDVAAYASTGHPLTGVRGVPAGPQPTGLGVDAVCLFSGGLDSLCGVIDLLEEDPNRTLCLVSHHEGGQASTAQQDLYAQLTAHYGTHRLALRRLYLRPAPANQWQTRPLPRTRENTTRARSMLFLSTALAIAASCGPNVPVYIPENGFIGINVPLTRARFGSLSTRTTHPHFMNLLQAAALTVGVGNPILNPYRLATKGEMLASSRNPSLLGRLAPVSVSCAHPEAPRWSKRRQGNCGYCFPCLIRRSAMAHVGWDNDEYAWDALTEAVLLDSQKQRGSDLRAVVNGAFTPRPDRDALRNGPLPAGERRAFVDVWRRGQAELRTWLASGAEGDLAQIIGALQ
ncbi:Qat anti-phage system QueC-like protein QatC [Dactylosporangium sp. NPDC000244]|uniref:Qat anti-phage system QueC-like protein QatC n=1 Tax=Dactylosporangium sp. NPDC000244 TaxID=3154365 RepID=UPI003331832D